MSTLRYISIFLFLITSLYSISSYGQSTELRDAFIKTSKAFKSKDYNAAELAANEAIKLAVKEFGLLHATTATLLENKGRIYLLTEKFNKAEKNFRESLNIRLEVLDPGDTEIAEVLDYLAQSVRNQNRPSEALEIHNKALLIMSNAIARDPHAISLLTRKAALIRAQALYSRAKSLHTNGKIEESLGYYRNSIKIFEGVHKKNHRDIEYILSDYSVALNELDQYDNSIKVKKQNNSNQ